MDIKQSGSDVPILSSATICLLMQISISTIDFWSTHASFANCFLTFTLGKKLRRDFSLAVTVEAFSVLIPLLRTQHVNRTNILDYSLYCYSRIWSVNRTSPKYVLCSRLKKSFESGEQFLLFFGIANSKFSLFNRVLR